RCTSTCLTGSRLFGEGDTHSAGARPGPAPSLPDVMAGVRVAAGRADGRCCRLPDRTRAVIATVPADEACWILLLLFGCVLGFPCAVIAAAAGWRERLYQRQDRER